MVNQHIENWKDLVSGGNDLTSGGYELKQGLVIF